MECNFQKAIPQDRTMGWYLRSLRGLRAWHVITANMKTWEILAAPSSWRKYWLQA